MTRRRVKILIVSLLAIVVAATLRIAAGAQPPPAAQPRSLETAAAAAANGKAIYEQRCVECHGPAGRGDGPAATLLIPHPRDFSLGRYKIRSTESGSVPTDEDLIRSVQQGLYGTAMSGWGAILSDAEITDVVAYVKSLSPRFATDAPEVVVPGAQVPSSPESIARGLQVYDALRCASCHGSDGRGKGAIATEFKDDWNQPLTAANLTEPWSFRGGSTARDVFFRFRTGMSGTPMPSFKGAATDNEMWDLANYVVSLGRKPVWSMTADEVRTEYADETVRAAADPIRRGKYLVDTHLCALCHSPLDDRGRIMPGMMMAGGQIMRVAPFGDYPTGNLTSDKETGLGSWSDDEIRQAITRGILRDGTRLPPYPMDWPAFSAFTREDLNAVVQYLRTIPPISNRVPRPSRPFLPVYLWAKFKMLILQIDAPIVIFPGNAGTPGAR